MIKGGLLNSLKSKIIIFFWLILLLVGEVSAQMLMGQYEDEAPLRTWNLFGLTTAPALSLGGSTFAYDSDPSVSLTNPALLSLFPSTAVTLNGSINSASLYSYGPVNTGVVTSTSNPSFKLYAFDFAGLSAPIKGWTIAVSVSYLEHYNRPPVEWEAKYKNVRYYTFKYDQTGFLRNYNFSLSRKIFPWLSAGLGFNFVSGIWQKTLEENWLSSGITIEDNKKQDIAGFYLNGGLSINPHNSLFIGLAFRTPFSKKTQAESLLRYSAPAGDTEIILKAEAENSYYQPLVLGAGLSYLISYELRAVLDISFFNWSSYSVRYFKEDLNRNFKDVILLKGGLEYWNSLNIFGAVVKIPSRIGFCYDPQPMKEPKSYYSNFSLGMGIHLGKFKIDTAVLMGRENGSGKSLSSQYASLTLSYFW
ncbi:MAG: OmpP1/FadL family transporter [Acidobacteriota bacterium]